MEIDIPRDRKGAFEPQIVKKYQNTVTQDMEEKIISMYAKAVSYTHLWNAKAFYYALQRIAIPNMGYRRHYPLFKDFGIPIPPLAEQQRLSLIHISCHFHCQIHFVHPMMLSSVWCCLSFPCGFSGLVLAGCSA